jgi:putative ABC transport system ATP-binding protein
VLLESRDLTVDLRGDEGIVRVLDGVSVSLARGEIVDIAGGSGSGKSTLLRGLARLLPDATGYLALDGIPATECPAREWRLTVALLPQKPAIADGSVRQNLLLPWTLKVRSHDARPDEADIRARLDGLGLTDVALDRDARRLSVGQQARVALLRMMLAAPRVLLLDEPDAALDSASSESVAGALRTFAADGGAVLRVRHRETDGLAGRRLRLKDGRLAEEGGS